MIVDFVFIYKRQGHRIRIPMRIVLFLALREISQSDTIVKQFQKEPTSKSAYIVTSKGGNVS